MASPYSFRSPELWLLWSRAIFVGIGIVYAGLCLLGNVHYALGRDSSDFDDARYHLQRAADVFPLNHGFRLGVVYYYMFLKRSAGTEIEQALKTDPHAWDLKRYARVK